jgi:hypothetical protein
MRRIAVIVVALGVAGCAMFGKSDDGEALRAEAPPANAPAEADGALASRSGAPPTIKGASQAAKSQAAAAPASARAGGTSGALDTHAIDEATGLTGAVMADGAYRITKPRGDLKVSLDGFAITPRMGLAGWVAFRAHPSGAMLRGAMPVAADELQAVVSALANAGLEPTALHSHFVGEEPRITFVHFSGVGNTVALARGVRDVTDAIARSRAARPVKPSSSDWHSELDVARLDGVLGARGEHDGQVYRVAIPRADVRVTELDVDLGPTMSPTSWAAFQGSADHAAVAGEIMLLPAEVQPVIHALRESRIGVVGIHDESAREEPRLAFVSFWGVGRLDALAAGIRKALDQLPRSG